MHRISLLALAVLLAVPMAPGLAQTPEEPAGLFEGLVEVSEVLLDVLATDRDGNVVLDLGPDDFVVTEAGEPVKVTSVDYYTTRYRSEGGDEIPASRYFIAFFHDQTRYGYFGNELIRQQIEAGRQLARWVREDMQGSDWLAVVTYDVKLKVHQDFTQDREALEQAIENAISGKGVEEIWPSRRERRTGARPLGVLARLPAGRELRRESRNVYDAMRLVAQAAGYVVGRKNLLLYTVGFGRRVGGGRATVPDVRYYSELATELNDHNVAVYPINITPAGNEPIYSDVLNQLAVDTGGTYYEDFVGFRAPLEKVSEENVGYYLLSYQTEHPAGEIGYQQVEVEARDPGIEVRARTGYRYGL